MGGAGAGAGRGRRVVLKSRSSSDVQRGGGGEGEGEAELGTQPIARSHSSPAQRPAPSSAGGSIVQSEVVGTVADHEVSHTGYIPANVMWAPNAYTISNHVEH